MTASSDAPGPVVVGNAAADGAEYRGWLMGHFVQPVDSLRASDAVEVKWATHARGDARPAWAVSAQATSLSLLIQGRVHLAFDTGAEARLAVPGDYALWPPGVAHRWRIEADDTVILTIRWPSQPGDAVDLPA